LSGGGKLFWRAVLAGFFICLMIFSGWALFGGIHAYPSSTQMYEVSGVLRNSGEDWVQADKYHDPLGLIGARVSDDGSHLVVEFSRPFDVVHSGSITADEYFVQRQPVRAGLSLGIDRAQIYFAAPDGTMMSPMDLPPLGNFFFQASGSVNVDLPEPTLASVVATKFLRRIRLITHGL
jgi:hypothetical protein